MGHEKWKKQDLLRAETITLYVAKSATSPELRAASQHVADTLQQLEDLDDSALGRHLRRGQVYHTWLLRDDGEF